MGNFAFLLPIMMSIFGGAFLELRRRGNTEAGHWAAGFLSAALAFCLPAIPPILPEQVFSLIADALFLCAFYFYGGALLRRFGRASFRLVRLSLCVLSFGSGLIGVFVLNSFAVELVSSDMGCAALLAFALARTFRHDKHMADRALMLVVALIITETVARNVALVVLTSSYGSVDDFLSSSYAFAMQAGAVVLALLLGLTSLAAICIDMIIGYRDSAERDVLTGLLNRRGFERLTGELPDEVLSASAMIACDLDQFKRINDTYGHAAGDFVLRRFSEEIKACLPRSAVAARFGGEEFVMFLPGQKLMDAASLANSLRLAIARSDLTEVGIGVSVTASFGVSSSDHENYGLYSQMSRADVALYAAKAAGRNRVMLQGNPPTELAAIRLAAAKSA